MSGDVSIRPFSDEDVDAVLDVLRAALGEPPGLERTPELFSWKHLDNPFGRSIMLIAEADGRIAGFRAFMRWELDTPGGRRLRCVRAVDTATHPDFQRRGIFSKLTMAGVDLATEDGIDLIFNTPNHKSGAGYLKMGWSEVGPIGVMARPSPRLLSRHDEPWPQSPAGDVASLIEQGRLDSDPDHRWQGVRTVRSREYLRWRFTSHPTARYAATANEGGAAVVRLTRRHDRNELVVSEMIGPSSPAAVRTSIRTYRPDYTVAWFSAGTPERRWATAAGLIPVPRVTALTQVVRPLADLTVDLSRPEAWHLSLGDLELL